MSNKFSGNENVAYLWYNKITCNGYENNLFSIISLFLFFIVSCTEDEVDPNFSIENVGDVVMGSAKGSQVTISFTSTREWKASTVADWFTIAPVSGEAGTCNITLTAISENITGSVRTATLTLTSGTLTQNIIIEQEPAEFVNLEQNIYNVSVEGGELDIRFSTNIAEDELLIYGSLGTGTWLTQETKTRASSSYMLNLTVLPNTDGVSRTAYIYFVKVTDMESIVVEIVTIIQRGKWLVNLLIIRQIKSTCSANSKVGKRASYCAYGRWIYRY